jgi:hypothetical protein
MSCGKGLYQAQRAIDVGGVGGQAEAELRLPRDGHLRVIILQHKVISPGREISPERGDRDLRPCPQAGGRVVMEKTPEG